jgi:hypothetical protein
MKKANLSRILLFGLLAALPAGWAPEALSAVRDVPFPQDSSEKFALAAELTGAAPRKLALDRDGNVLVLTDRGMARLYPETHSIVLDRAYRSFGRMTPKDLAVWRGEVFYLTGDQFFSNIHAGEFSVSLATNDFTKAAVAAGDSALLTGPKTALWLGPRGPAPVRLPEKTTVLKVYAHQGRFFLLTDNGIYVLRTGRFFRLHEARDLTALGFRGGEIVVGTQNGYYNVSASTGRVLTARNLRLPAPEITAVEVATNGVWFGTRKGVFLEAADGTTRYYASRRWLREDQVLDLRADGRGNLYVLGPSSVSLLRFAPTTLAAKAALYEENIRRRHIRYGMCAEVRLGQPGELSTAVMIDTDNDGTWSSYYMASQAFHYAATGDERARERAWETFEAMERLLAITGVPGLPARSFERTGFKTSDPEKWRPAAENGWEWKSDTSSDEITAHWFAASVMLDCAVTTPAERQRVVRFLDAITGNIVRNGFRLIDWNGQPTLWGRWDPDYLNNYPFSVFDRRLNSTEILGGLQLAFRATGQTIYSQAFDSLVLVLGPNYLQNVLSPMSLIAPTRGAVHGGGEMGDVWNHSDDLLAFISYWTLTRTCYAGLRPSFVAAVRDHFQYVKAARCPLFNFIYASTGAADAEIENAVWTLRGFPLDLVTWRMVNSERQDITKLPPGFQRQELAELLPPGERQITRWNTHPFILDGGDGGYTELAGDEFLLPYWMGRYLKLIE